MIKPYQNSITKFTVHIQLETLTYNVHFNLQFESNNNKDYYSKIIQNLYHTLENCITGFALLLI